VFVHEQSVPPDLEWDGEDANALHFLALENGTPIATARLLPDGKIGRMAVLSAYRSEGVGSRLLAFIETVAREQSMKRLTLNSQTQAIPFYQKAGYRVFGDEFMDAGIPHFQMGKQLD